MKGTSMLLRCWSRDFFIRELFDVNYDRLLEQEEAVFPAGNYSLPNMTAPPQADQVPGVLLPAGSEDT